MQQLWCWHLQARQHGLPRSIKALVGRGLGYAKNWFKKLIGIRLGVLRQYPPRPLDLRGHVNDAPDSQSLPVISLITPSFNQGRFLERTLRSVLEQRYPRLEYIVQDGGSTDESGLILEHYRGLLTHCESTSDQGQADAINRGFRHARGEILAYLNSDDILLPGTLAYVASFFASHPQVDVVYGHRILIDAQDREIGRWVLPPHDDSVLTWTDYVPQETLFWRRSIWEKTGSRLDEWFEYALDWELLLRFRQAGARFTRLPRFLAAFRVHPAQKTATSPAVGQGECAAIRRQLHRRSVSLLEVKLRCLPYLLRHALYYRLYQAGLFDGDG